jgi:hypothetical protein
MSARWGIVGAVLLRAQGFFPTSAIPGDLRNAGEWPAALNRDEMGQRRETGTQRSASTPKSQRVESGRRAL